MANYQLQMAKLKFLIGILTLQVSWIQNHFWLGNRKPNYSISLHQRYVRNPTTSDQIRKFNPEDR